MSDLPDPLVPTDVDLRNFTYMPLDVARLRDSDLAALVSAEAFRAAVILWCAAWHQIPAASLPADDQALARLAGYGRDLAGWRKAKEGALRGFVECTDGRLYHPVIAEKALTAWDAKQAQYARTAAATAARLAKQKMNEPRDDQRDVQRDETRHEQRDVKRHEGRSDNVTSTKGEGEGNRDISSLRSDSRPKRVRTRHAYLPDFIEFWEAYPTDPNMGKREAFDEWLKLSDEERRQAIASCPSFVKHCQSDSTYRPIHANRYLAKRRFEGHAAATATDQLNGQRIDFGGGVTAPHATIRTIWGKGQWLAQWGPTPDEPGCRVPAATMAEIMREAA